MVVENDAGSIFGAYGSVIANGSLAGVDTGVAPAELDGDCGVAGDEC